MCNEGNEVLHQKKKKKKEMKSFNALEACLIKLPLPRIRQKEEDTEDSSSTSRAVFGKKN